MVHPLRDTLIALVLTLAGLAALAYGVPRLMVDENDVAGSIAAVAGGLTAFFASLMVLNFLWGIMVARRMTRGENVIARWIVKAAEIDAYLAAEQARPWAQRSRWKPRPGREAEVIFTRNGVLAGGRFHGLEASGPQHFFSVEALPGDPVTLQFASREISAGPSDNLRWYASVLRLPVTRGADEAAQVVLTHFRKVLSGEIRLRPTFWPKRIRIGQVTAVVGLTFGGAGWLLAERAGWREDDTSGTVALILLVVGVMVTLAGVSLALFATKFHRADLRRTSSTPR
jgi:hypothetical protein